MAEPTPMLAPAAEAPPRGRRHDALVVLAYALAIAAYVAISFATKRLLTWTNGPLYFLFVLALVPAGVRRIARLARR